MRQPLSRYHRYSHYSTLFLSGVIAFLAMILMMVTTVDVIGRYVFNHPLPGSTELTEICMGLLIFATLPVICRQNQHISVDLLDKVLSHSFKKWSNLAIQVILLLGVGFLGYGMYLLTERALRDDLTSEILLIPLWISRFLITILTIFSMVGVVLYILSMFQKEKSYK